METLDPKAGHLSNFEVLTILRQQKADRQKEVDKVHKLRKANKAIVVEATLERVQPAALHTVTFEAIKYLEEDVHPLRRLTAASVSRLTKDLRRFELTKAEVLMIVNNAPTSLVELTAHIEAFDQRFPRMDQQEDLLKTISSALSAEASAATISKQPAPKKAEEKMDVDKPSVYVAQEEEEEEQQQGDDEENELVQEGLSGGVDPTQREIDEVDD